MAKSLKDILAGVKSSKKEKLDLSNMHDYHSKDGEDFIAKHEVEKHADRVGNGDEVYKGKTKEANYKKQSDKVYESECNHTDEGTHCEMHGDKPCPDYNDNKKSKGKKLLLDKDAVKEEYIEEKLTAKDTASKWIHDFVHSDNPKFAGKSSKQRQQMALGAYYSKKKGKTKNEQADTAIKFPGQVSGTSGGTDLDSVRV